MSGVECENIDKCNRGKCIDSNGKETIVVDVIPHVHTLKSLSGEENNKKVTEYFLHQLKECKNSKEKIVMNIFFESLLLSDWSYDFAKDPINSVLMIDNLKPVKGDYTKEDIIGELQFKYFLIKEFLEHKKEYENVKINFIATPSKKYNDGIVSFVKNLGIDASIADILIMIRDKDTKQLSFKGNAIKSKLIKKNGLESFKLLDNKIDEIMDEKNLTIHTREFYSIMTILEYLSTEKIEGVHKYYLVFGKYHKFYKWNTLTDFITQNYNLNIKFVRNEKTYDIQGDEPSLDKVIRI